ncbi:MAG: LytR C-terminal domain-containing protein [bacterium]|nr:LytR C-terminal domain-containing protein [bacterium]
MKKKLFRFLFASLICFLFAWLIWVLLLSQVRAKSPYKDEVIILTSKVIDDKKGIFLIAHVGSEVSKQSLHALSGKTVVTLPKEYGQYELGAVLPLLELEGKSVAYKRAVFSRIFSIPVGSFLAIDELVPGDVDFSKLQGVLHRSAVQKLRAFTMPWQELAILPLLTQQSSTISSSLEEVQAQLQSAMVRSTSRSELACTVAIVNTTTESGLARQLATVLEQGGVRVVRITDTSNTEERSRFVMDADRTECAWIEPLVRSWFFSDLEVQQKSETEQSYRAWGVVFIGSDAH